MKKKTAELLTLSCVFNRGIKEFFFEEKSCGWVVKSASIIMKKDLKRCAGFFSSRGKGEGRNIGT